MTSRYRLWCGALLLACGCNRGETGQRRADLLISTYGSDFRIGATFGELARSRTWKVGAVSERQAFASAKLPRHVDGIVGVAVLLEVRGDVVDASARAIEFILYPDSTAPATSAAAMHARVVSVLGAPSRSGCTGSVSPVERVEVWRLRERRVNLILPVGSTNPGNRLIVTVPKEDRLRFRACPS
jgi:hypothetical protein